MKIHEDEKRCYEIRAKKILEMYFNNLYILPLRNADKPDILDKNCKVGIEVTRAFYEDSAETYGLFNQYRDKSINDIPAIVMEKLSLLGAELLFNDNYIMHGVFLNLKRLQQMY